MSGCASPGSSRNDSRYIEGQNPSALGTAVSATCEKMLAQRIAFGAGCIRIQGIVFARNNIEEVSLTPGWHSRAE